ncbi:YigZ family protein [Thalassotalea euphylliae]|uniref:YigZ family protein n=1 Tax=Thalassotalea euphylliae TaxID=1655234 RepID=UPI00363886F6
MPDYKIPVEEVMHETTVNRSRFLCYLFPCQNAEMFKARLAELQQEHPSANHHCYAFVKGSPMDSQQYGFSDDGEPSGTAGRPMLAVLQGSGIGEVAAIVVRYFGGVKLGTGGLQRAYGGAVREALPHVKTTIKVAVTEKELTCDYQEVSDIQHLIKTFKAHVVSEDYQENVKMLLAIPDDQLKLFEQQLLTVSSGRLTLVNPPR